MLKNLQNKKHKFYSYKTSYVKIYVFKCLKKFKNKFHPRFFKINPIMFSVITKHYTYTLYLHTNKLPHPM